MSHCIYFLNQNLPWGKQTPISEQDNDDKHMTNMDLFLLAQFEIETNKANQVRTSIRRIADSLGYNKNNYSKATSDVIRHALQSLMKRIDRQNRIKIIGLNQLVKAKPSEPVILSVELNEEVPKEAHIVLSTEEALKLENACFANGLKPLTAFTILLFIKSHVRIVRSGDKPLGIGGSIYRKTLFEAVGLSERTYLKYRKALCEKGLFFEKINRERFMPNFYAFTNPDQVYAQLQAEWNVQQGTVEKVQMGEASVA